MSSDATRARRRQMPVVRCHQVPDAARCQSPDTSCLMSPPPGPGGGLGEVSRAPVLMSFVLISGSCCRRQFWSPTACDDERRAPAVKSGVSLLLDVRCQTVLFRAFLSPTRPPDINHLRPLGRRPRRLRSALLSPMRCPDFHRLRPLGHRPRRLRNANRRLRPWRPVAAATAAVAAGWPSYRSN